MKLEEIEEELKSFDGDIYFISILSEFVWDQTNKKVVSYSEQSTPKNKLVVMSTTAVDLKKKTLTEYMEKEGVTAEDVLIFCINEEFYPKQKGNWILVNILKKINKKKYDTGRNDIKRLPKSDSPNATRFGISTIEQDSYDIGDELGDE